MHTLPFSSWLFLAFLALALPYGAIRTAQRTRSAEGPALAASRTQLHLNSMASHLLIFGIAWYAGFLQGLQLLRPVHLTAFDYLAGAVTLALMGAMLGVSKLIRSEDEQQRMWVLGFLPTTRREAVPYTLLAATAAFSEELAYRGVAFQMLTLLTGSAVAGAVLSGVFFAAAHFPQGGKSMGIIFVIALIKQELVALTGTLWVAIGVHFLYNVIAAIRLAPHARAATAPHSAPHD